VHKKALALAYATAYYYEVAKERDKRGLHELGCVECGIDFVGRKNELYCGSRCAHRAGSKARSVRLRGARRERVSTAAVLRRDGYRCAICGGKLAMAETVPHPKAPTLDHILPVANGGSHTMANLRAAHFSCHTKRGNRGAAPLVLMCCLL